MDDELRSLHDALAWQRELGGRYVARVATDGPPPVLSAPETVSATPAPEPVTAALASPETAVLLASEDPSDAMATPDLFGNAADADEPASGTPYERIDALIPDDHPVKSAQTLAELEAIVRSHVFIPLDKSRILPVFGVGDPHAGLLVIGEAPGADEDRLGEPFVGRAGQLLNKILAAIGFKREEVYISNILKSRPPNNRDPEPDEIAAHLPILLKQMVLIEPKVILCVGKTSGNGLLDRRSSLAALRDKEHSFHGIPLYVTYHPAALLRNEQWKRPTWEDVKLVRTRYDALVGNKAG